MRGGGVMKKVNSETEPQINVRTNTKRKQKLDAYVEAKGTTITAAIEHWIDRLTVPQLDEEDKNKREK